jgi:hypothetical protein
VQQLMQIHTNTDCCLLSLSALAAACRQQQQRRCGR